LRDFTPLAKWAALGPGLVALAGVVAFRFSRIRNALLVVAFISYCGLEFGISLYQARVQYATTYDYGQTGFLDAVAFIDMNTAPADVIVSMKDVGFRAHRRYYEDYPAIYGDGAAESRLVEAIASGKAAYAVFTEGHGEDQLIVNPSMLHWVAEHCELVRSFGNYRIYKLRLH
jgi:hypothetical protein